MEYLIVLNFVSGLITLFIQIYCSPKHGLWALQLMKYMYNLFLFKFNSFNKHLHSEKNFSHLKPRYTDPCNFLTKLALVSQPSMPMVAKESNISHYLNSPIHFANDYSSHYIIHTLHHWPSEINSNLIISITKLTLSLINLLLIIIKFFINLWGTTMQGLCNTMWP